MGHTLYTHVNTPAYNIKGVKLKLMDIDTMSTECHGLADKGLIDHHTKQHDDNQTLYYNYHWVDGLYMYLCTGQKKQLLITLKM